MPRSQRSNPNTKHNAIELRKRLTSAEHKLWSRIRNDQLGVTFRRQHAVGNYIPDFCCPKAKLIIELDGSQHLQQEKYDEEGTKYLKSLGYKVIRFWNNDVTKILMALYSPLFMRWKMKPVKNRLHPDIPFRLQEEFAPCDTLRLCFAMRGRGKGSRCVDGSSFAHPVEVSRVCAPGQVGRFGSRK